MKQMFENVRKTTLFTLMVLMLFSCSIEKRLYLSGYNVDWIKNKKVSNSYSAEIKQESNLIDSTTEIVENEIDENQLSASIDNKTLYLVNTNDRKIINKKEFISQKQNISQTNKNSFRQDLNRNNKSSIVKKDNSRNSDSESFFRKWGDVMALITVLALVIGIIMFLHWLYVHYLPVFLIILGALGLLLIIGILINIVNEIKDKKKNNSP